MIDIEFEYRLTPGIHHGWRVESGGTVVEPAADSLSEVEDALDNAVFTYCAEHSAIITLVRGGHGWREFTTTSGDVLTYEWTLLERDFRCIDCGYDTWNETYRVDDSLWAAAGNAAGRLCIGCLEQRINRPITPEDFVNNDPNSHAAQPSSPRLRDRRDPPRPARPKITYDAPIGPVDLRAFNEVGDPFEITACMHCLPWHAEVVRDPETNEILIREWHAVECEVFQELIEDD